MWFEDKIWGVDELATIHKRIATPLAVFYSAGKMLHNYFGNRLTFAKMVGEQSRAMGYTPVIVNASAGDWAVNLPNSVHFWTLDRLAKPANHPNLFYISPSYFHGFWYFDRLGVRQLSSIGKADYDPKCVDEREARVFYAGLQKKFVQAKRTKYAQTQGDFPIPEGSILIAAQDPCFKLPYEIYIGYEELLPAVITNRQDRPIWIKPHPASSLEGAMIFAQFHDADAAIYFEEVELHAALARCSLVVTRCSAVALEAMLHKKPAIVSGPVDYHHGVESIYNPNEMAAAMKRLATRDFSYEKYLYWFLKEQLFEPADTERTTLRIRKMLASAR